MIELGAGFGAAPSRTDTVREVGAVSIGMSVFALFAHRGGWPSVLGALGLIAAATTVGRSLQHTRNVRISLGATPITVRVVAASIVGLGLGCRGGWLYAQGAHAALANTGDQVRAFLVLAVAVGVAEEFVYRGWLQGRLAQAGPVVAVGIAATAHAAYKTALFALPASGVEIAFDLPAIAVGTFAGGLMLGTLRAVSGSVVPAVLGHAAFDALGYAAYQSAPWWLW